jgi:hypothetical protein
VEIWLLSILEMIRMETMNEARRLASLMEDRVRQKHHGHLMMAMLAGSHGYGLSTPESDVDVRCIHVVHSERLFGLLGLSDSASTEQMSVENGDDCDIVSQEVGKFCRLALECNPNILEMLFAPQATVVVSTPDYQALRDLRFSCLSTDVAIKAYLGYSRSQLERLLRKQGDQQMQLEMKNLKLKDATFRMMMEADRFGLDTVEYDVKHAMHLCRLLLDLETLLRDGSLAVDMTEHRERLMAIRGGRVTLAEIVGIVNERIIRIEEVLASGKSVLPEKPEKEQIEAFLVSLRKRLL